MAQTNLRFKVGQTLEVRSFEDGYRGAWLRCEEEFNGSCSKLLPILVSPSRVLMALGGAGVMWGVSLDASIFVDLTSVSNNGKAISFFNQF
ncbi:unnamed protein product [Brassica napus]|uniref:(rape) hypothetical protein n=1 Tax=Brassica napus TaxID=3708 RepID=A0A816I392_BRANA|nr:unnamed protein product [Brassica napus]